MEPEATGAERTWRRSPQPSILELMQEFLILRKLRPGDRLPTEGEFSEQFGASRNAVREALRALEVLGIVEIRHGQGMYLQDASLDGLAAGLTFWSRVYLHEHVEALRPMAEVRDALESSMVLRVLGRHTQTDLADLEDAVNDMERLAAQGYHAPEADRRFHEVLYRPLDNWVLTFLLHAFWDTVKRVSAVADVPTQEAAVIAAQHRAILNALLHKDEAAVYKAMNSHFDNVLRRSDQP